MIKIEFCVEDFRAQFGHRAAEAIVPCDTTQEAFLYVCRHYDAMPTKTMRYTRLSDDASQRSHQP